jgi:hypothetical protein
MAAALASVAMELVYLWDKDDTLQQQDAESAIKKLSGAATGFLILGIFGRTPSANRPAPKPRSHREFPVKVLNLGSHMKRRHRREFQAMSFAPRFFVRSLERFAKTVVILKCRDKQKPT